VGCGDQPVLLDTSRWQAGAGPAAGGPPEFRVMDNGGRPGSGLVSCRLSEQLQEAAPAAAGDPSRNAAAEHPEARSRLRERRVGEAGSPLWPLVMLRAVRLLTVVSGKPLANGGS